MTRRTRIFSATLWTTLLSAGFVVADIGARPALGAETEAPKAEAAKPPAISVAPAAHGEVANTETVIGSLVPREEVLVGVDLDGYKITSVDAEIGDRVKAGQVLARLSADTLDILLAQNEATLARNDAAIAQAKSQIAETQASEIEARSSLERGTSLKSKGFVAEATLDERRAQADAATARRAAAEQGLAVAEAERNVSLAARRELELRLAKTEVKAPTDGIVLSRNARIGAIVSSGAEPMFRIARDGVIELEAQVPETSLARIAAGQPVRVIAPGRDKPLRGSVRLVSPRIDSATRLGSVRIALPDDADLFAGAFARGTIEIARHDGVVLPLSAIVPVAGVPTAQVVKDGRIETRKLQTGISGDGLVEIVDGVREGELVVTRAGTFVRDGDQVTPIEAPAAGAGG